MREAQVLQDMLDGVSAPESSVKLGIGASTVRTYRQRVKSKLAESGFADILRSGSDESPEDDAKASPCEDPTGLSGQIAPAQDASSYAPEASTKNPLTRVRVFFRFHVSEVLQAMLPALVLLLFLPFGFEESFSSRMLWQSTAVGFGAGLLPFWTWIKGLCFV